jgi:two-component system NtrC family sensor kinase
MAAQSSRSILRQLLPMSVVGFGASFVMFLGVLVLERQGADARFHELASQRLNAVRANIAIALGSVSLVVGHFSATPPLETSRDGFRRMVMPTIQQYSFFQGLSWDPLVPREHRRLYEDLARRQGYAGLVLTERDAQGQTREVADREEYVPVLFMEPYAGNERAIGFDLASNPVRRQALHAARDSGKPVVTGRITLVQESGDQFGVLVLAPVYAREPNGDVAANRRALLGYVSGVFRLGDLVESAGPLSLSHGGQQPVDIHLFDLSAPAETQRLYPKSTQSGPEQRVDGTEVAVTFEMAGRQWQLVASRSQAFRDANRPVMAFALLGAALLATLFYLSFLKGRVERAENATRFAQEVGRARQRLSEAQRIARLATIEIDAATGSIALGDGAAAMLGLNAEADTLMAVFAHVHPEDQAALSDQVTGTTIGGLDREFRVVLGSEERVISAVSAILDVQDCTIITLQDVTARRQAERERTALVERIAEANRFEALGTLAGGIAHEINTPTQYVGDNIVFMRDGIESLLDVVNTGRHAGEIDAGSKMADALAAIDLDFLAAELPAAADQAKEGTERIARIVQAIKEFSYPSSKIPKPFDLNHMIDIAATVTRNQWKYVADLDLDLDPDLPMPCAIEGEINQVLVNLVVNAAQAISMRGEGVIGRISIATRHHDGWIEVVVTDTGIGIPEANHGRIFEMFFTTKAPGEGTGQGLAISKAIMLRHQGSIDVSSVPGQGSRFTIRLPVGGAPTGEEPGLEG